MTTTFHDSLRDGIETGVVTEVKVSPLTDEIFNHILLESTSPGVIMVTEVGPDKVDSLELPRIDIKLLGLRMPKSRYNIMYE